MIDLRREEQRELQHAHDFMSKALPRRGNVYDESKERW